MLQFGSQCVYSCFCDIALHEIKHMFPCTVAHPERIHATNIVGPDAMQRTLNHTQKIASMFTTRHMNKYENAHVDHRSHKGIEYAMHKGKENISRCNIAVR